MPEEPPASENDSPWELDIIGKLSASQAAYNNWTEGGLNTLALATTFNIEAVHATENWRQTHQGQLALGLVQQDTFSVRKADDHLRLSSSFQYRGDGLFHTFNPTFAATLRTQFLTGYNYDRNPFSGDDRDPPVKVSDFMAPATFTQSVGLSYEPSSWLVQRMSLGAKQVVVTRERLGALYGLSPTSQARYEAGLESKTEVDRELVEDVQLQSTLSLFAAFNRDDAPDMFWENLISLRFNKWLSVDFEMAALYDSDITQALQLKERISVGASVVML